MLSGRRPFRKVGLTVTGAQSFKDRFPQHESVPGLSGGNSIPTPCNVTGLSQVHNLYFVAYRGEIHVYEPQFPSQCIGAEPALIINTEALPNPSDQRRVYARYASQQTRDINKLLVQPLGNQEVVAVVRHDGDVEAYYTRDISRAIERRRYDDNSLGVFASDIRPLLHKNVGLSAWGLAIHTNARMIAVSSNTHATTVFTFALSDGETDDEIDLDDLPAHEHRYFSMSGVIPPNDRRKNDVRILAHPAGLNNLPDIAFCNTGDDPTGRWLLTADISGSVATWDVHNLLLVQLTSTAISPPIFPLHPGVMDNRNGLWGVMFLDPRSFRPARSVEEAVNVSSMLDGFDFHKERQKAIWDLGKTVDQIEDVRRPFKDVGNPVRVLDGNYADPLATSRITSNGALTVPISGHASNGAPTARNRRPARNDSNNGEDEDESEDEDEDEESEEDEDDTGYDSAEQTHIEYEQPDGSIHRKEIPKPITRFGSHEGMAGNLPCPILQLSWEDIYLYQPSPTNTAWNHFPIPTLRRPFKQHLLAYLDGSPISRINMYAQIPTLGVVILATQRGRVAILSLTSTHTELPDYSSTSKGQYTRPPIRRKFYGMRIDHVLPLPAQEAAGHRPKAGIHGIAVGPVQGTEHLEDDQKRWRLLVHYQNHAVLSYEIGRPKGDAFDIELLAL